MEQDLLNNIVDTLYQMKDSERKANKLRDIIPIEEWIKSEGNL